MSAVRRPVIVGLARGAGTSTLAAALHATDGGLLRPGAAGEADVLLCPSDAASVGHAARLARAPAGPRPVLVLAQAPGPPAAPPRAIHGFAAVLALPHLARWAGTDDRATAAAVLAFPPDALPPDVASYAAALRRVVDVLTGSGMLDRLAPPLVSRPAAAVLRIGLQPLPRPVATAAPTTLAATTAPTTTAPVPRWVGPRSEPDDDTLEAGPPPLAAGRAG
ncbi:hypothetical protein [Pseudonocardia kunmingensis]|uniref:Uncharacterized protein n=1 Tax=Pseudonocardia kunmingensis TaxID=630975 RepID=A0A543DA74_9PSEU|nr:hypothetical protein [Pseudonocardia kunmingensis]TQM06220.1 hypothetical protein FB558_6465 [Pseudonocardia kunmingensis]